MAGTSQTTDYLSHWCPVCVEEVAVEPSTFGTGAKCSICGRFVWCRVQEAHDAVIVNVLPTVDPERANMQLVGKKVLSSRSAPRIIVNLSGIEWVSSTFVNELLQLRMMVHGADGKLTLCGVQPIVREVLQITKLESLFNFAEDEESALGG